MKEYKVKILDSVFDDIDSLADFIVSVSLPEYAIRYVRELGAEIMFHIEGNTVIIDKFLA